MRIEGGWEEAVVSQPGQQGGRRGEIPSKVPCTDNGYTKCASRTVLAPTGVCVRRLAEAHRKHRCFS